MRLSTVPSAPHLAFPIVMRPLPNALRHAGDAEAAERERQARWLAERLGLSRT